MRLLTVLLAAALAADARVVVGEFSTGALYGWEEKSFEGHTRYMLVTDEGRRALQARSRAAASGLFKRIHVDLRETPYLNWSWKVEETLGEIEERRKQGDDYPARVYVVFSGGLLFWRTRAVNYVWSSSQAKGARWLNAYTDNAGMIAVQAGAEAAGEWVAQRRDVREDYRRLFGEDVRFADAVAIMTDTDDTGKAATAYYGDIYFSAQ